MLWRDCGDIGACAHDVSVQVSKVSSLPHGGHGQCGPTVSGVWLLHGLVTVHKHISPAGVWAQAYTHALACSYLIT